MKVIGITGGVGAGKSKILSFLQETYGACVIQADSIGHQVMEPGTAGYEKVIETFGQQILRKDGMIDRSVLGEIVFADEGRLAALNAIIHPAVKDRIRELIRQEREKGICSLVVVEAALLIEDHYEELCQEFWYIYTRESVRRERLKSSRGYTDEKITSVFQSQQSEESFRSHCQVVIDNNGTIEETCAQIRRIIEGET
jgi:dephospho-CoA kinase